MSSTGLERALVVGAGIGGLAAVTLLARRGVDVRCCEIETAYRSKGIGLGIATNGLLSLERLDIADDFMDVGFEIDRIDFFDDDARHIGSHVFELRDDTHPSFCAARREHLHSLLVQAAADAGATVQLGRTITELEIVDDGVAVTFDDGDHDTFDIVIGFDGIGSITREILFDGRYEPTYTGYGIYRVKIPRPDEVDGMRNYLAFGEKAAFLPISEDEMYLAYSRAEPEDQRFSPSELFDTLQARLSRFEGLPKEVLRMIGDESDIVYSPLEVMPAPPLWFRDRIVIGGDAAHPSPPHLTQGASMALEDAVVLSQELTSSEDPLPTRLSRYLRRRFVRCTYVQDVSHRLLAEEMRTDTALDRSSLKRDIVDTWVSEQEVADQRLRRPDFHQ